MYIICAISRLCIQKFKLHEFSNRLNSLKQLFHHKMRLVVNENIAKLVLN